MHPRTARLATALALLAAALPSTARAQQPPPAPPPSPPAETAPPSPPPASPAQSDSAPTTAPDAGVALPPPPPPDAAPTPQPQVAPAPAPQGPRTAVIDAAPLGVDPVAARFVTDTLRARVAELGFQVIPTQELYGAAARLQLPFPVPAEGIYELERLLQAPVAVHAEVRAAHGQYVVRLRVRVAVERGERVQEVSATQFQLADALRQAMPALLVPPRPAAAGPQGPQAEPEPPAPRLRRQRTVRAHPRRFELGLGVVGAFGPGQDPFANALVMARGRWFPIDRFGVSLSAAYTNLRGRDERVSNVLFLAGVETSVDLVPSSRVFIPLRFEAGYLPNNGPVFRLTAGVAFNLSRRIRMEIDVLSPTVWVLPETSPVTLDLAAHVSFAL